MVVGPTLFFPTSVKRPLGSIKHPCASVKRFLVDRFETRMKNRNNDDVDQKLLMLVNNGVNSKSGYVYKPIGAAC